MYGRAHIETGHCSDCSTNPFSHPARLPAHGRCPSRMPLPMRLRLPWHAARRSHAKGRFLLTTRSLRTDHEREGMRSASKTASGDADQAALLSTQDAKANGKERSPEGVELVAEDDHKSGLASIVASGVGVRDTISEKWDSLPARAQLVFAMGVCFVICNMDKVNISVAIIPMSQEFGWSPTMAGLVQSAFFWGYMLSQLPGGIAVNRFSGRRVLPAGVALWSLATAVLPVCSTTTTLLCVSRAVVGVGEAVAPSSITDIVAKGVPKEERSRAVSFIFGGLQVGSIAGLLLAPELIKAFGWQSVFYIFGGAGLVWVVWWERLVSDIRSRGGENNPVLLVEQASDAGRKRRVPWRAMLRCKPLRALAVAHFSNNWFHYSMLAWLPTYFSDTLHLELSRAAQVSLIPPLVAIAASAIAGTSADLLLARGWPTARVRKTAQAIAFLGPSVCLATSITTDDATATVALIAAALGLNSFSLAGLYCNHQDLSPRYASILLGTTNVVASIPGIVGVAAVGALLDVTHSWALSLFVPSVTCFAIGTAIFTLFGSADPVDLDDPALNEQFPWEAALGIKPPEPLEEVADDVEEEDVMPLH